MAKTILMSICILFFTGNLFAADPPAEVKKALEQKFPHALEVKWVKENTHEYEASFTWQGFSYSSNFSDLGTWLETECMIEFNQLPINVQRTFLASHQAAKIKAVAKIETSQGVLKYEIEMKKGFKTVELFYTETGMELKE